MGSRFEHWDIIRMGTEWLFALALFLCPALPLSLIALFLFLSETPWHGILAWALLLTGVAGGALLCYRICKNEAPSRYFSRLTADPDES